MLTPIFEEASNKIREEFPVSEILKFSDVLNYLNEADISVTYINNFIFPYGFDSQIMSNEI